MAATARPVVHFVDLDRFRDRTEYWMVREEARYNRLLGISPASAAADRTSPPLCVILEAPNGEIVGCALQRRAQQLDLTAMPIEGAHRLVEALLERRIHPGRVGGPPEVSTAFVEAWAEATGDSVRSLGRHGIYSCESLVEPTRETPGVVEPADASLQPTLTEWMADFVEFTGLMLPNAEQTVHGLLASGSLYVLTIGGTAVCMGAVSRTTPSGAALSFIYSPPSLRGNGHATALTAGLTRRLFLSGYRFCCLHTDLDFDVSNRIYRGLGYRLIAETADFALLRRD